MAGISQARKFDKTADVTFGALDAVQYWDIAQHYNVTAYPWSVSFLPTKPRRTRMGDKEWHNGRRAPTQDPSTNNRRLCVGAEWYHALALEMALHAVRLQLGGRIGFSAPGKE